MPRLDLRKLILGLALLSLVLGLGSALYSAHRVQEDLLIRNTLEANRTYAAKLADTADTFIATIERRLAYASRSLAELMGEPAALQAQARRLQQDTNSFNAVVIVDARGVVQASYPDSLALNGEQLRSEGDGQSLQRREPFVSAPYRSARGRLVVSLSQPIVDGQGRYRGYVAGAIYLQEPNILQNILGLHYYQDGSYLYVVEGQHRLIIYHPELERIGEMVLGNPAIEAVIAGQTGSMRMVNSKGVDMLAGYAPLRRTGWGVVAQRPVHATLTELDLLLRSTVLRTLPLLLASMLIVWALTRVICRPLWQLARQARHMDGMGTAYAAIEKLPAWYFEAFELKRSLLAGLSVLDNKIDRLNRDALTDPLTGLHNRRGMDAALDTWLEDGRGFAIVALDIDHFKHVNDVFGHDVGDSVLREMGALMREHARPTDLLCRPGGEEFSIFMPGTSAAGAREAAERLRRAIADHAFAVAGTVTVSLGVAELEAGDHDLERALKRADRALYQAKKDGRNRTMVAEPG
ncbi:diguanylate cyclase [Ramlibacter sp. H39-3-26]|uniref:sensor domain-containing diguanylate cyclase n=1 Tax=Curvibacter soli TaxID=3031331 RepID=UPI0023DA78CF|nr:sensor domain-containing diguanylate cyclase [Ramlibacter sp. H39-3-26]MDF1485046.1 diguanylate cyclase [Ramlibacter sp. H39-3-26]